MIRCIIYNYYIWTQLNQRTNQILGTPYSNKDSYRIGEGGNACAYKITKQNGEQVVLKELKSGFCDSEKNKIKFSEKIQRFRDEIITMQNLKSEQGIMPIIESNLDGLFYTMPYATPIMDYLKPLYNKCPNNKENESIEGIESLPNNIVVAYSKEDVETIRESVSKQINGTVDIILHRVAKPSHLFTEEEIKDEMIKADDRKTNTLIINEDGYAKVVEGNNQGQFYPASIDSWDIGSGNVGKYRQEWTDLHLLYEDILVAWYEHLKYGGHCHHYDLFKNSSAVGFESIEDLKKEVLKYY